MPPSPERRRLVSPDEGEEEIFPFDDQTEEERQLVRRRQRQVFEKMKDHTEAMEDPLLPTWNQHRQENNDIYKTGVRRGRELQMDGKIVQFVAERATQQTKKLVQVPKYDTLRVTQQLRRKFYRRKCSGFDWRGLGKCCSACFYAVPPNVQFFNGPLQVDFQPKERVVRQRRKASQEDGFEEEHPEEQEAKKDGQANASEKAVKKIYEILKRKHDAIKEENEEYVEGLPVGQQRAAKRRIKEQGQDQVDATRLLVDPKSFTQTVENIFHFSFLVNSAKTSIKVIQDRPVVAPTSIAEQTSDDRPPARQAIVSFSLNDFRRLCRASKLNEGYLPHRSSESVEASASSDGGEVMYDDDDEEKCRQGSAEESDSPTDELEQSEAESARAYNSDDDDKVMNDDDEEKCMQDSAEESGPPTGELEQESEAESARAYTSDNDDKVMFDDDDEEKCTQDNEEESRPPTGEQEQSEAEVSAGAYNSDDDDEVINADGVNDDDDEKSTQKGGAEQSTSPSTSAQDRAEELDRASPIIDECGESVISLRTLFDDYQPQSQPAARRVTQDSLTYQPEHFDSQSPIPARRVTQDYHPSKHDGDTEDWL